MGLSATDLEKIKAMIISVFKDEIMNEIDQKIKTVVKQRVNSEVNEQVAHFEKDIEELRHEVDDLKKRNFSLERLTDRQEQAARSLNIRVFGIQYKEGEDLRRVVLDVFNRKMKCNLKDSDIKNCYRIISKKVHPDDNGGDVGRSRITRSHSGGSAGNVDSTRVVGIRTPAVLVQFYSDSCRSTVLQERKQLANSGLRIREDLTRYRVALFQKAVEKFTSKAAWCLHGNVYIKLHNEVHRIQDFEALEALQP